MCSTDQPTHSSLDIPFGWNSSLISGIISEHDDIFLFISESLCSSASPTCRTRDRDEGTCTWRENEWSKGREVRMKTWEARRKRGQWRGHTDKELLDVQSIIDTSSQFTFLTKVIDPNLSSAISGRPSPSWWRGRTRRAFRFPWPIH